MLNVQHECLAPNLTGENLFIVPLNSEELNFPLLVIQFDSKVDTIQLKVQINQTFRSKPNTNIDKLFFWSSSEQKLQLNNCCVHSNEYS